MTYSVEMLILAAAAAIFVVKLLRAALKLISNALSGCLWLAILFLATLGVSFALST